MELTVQQNQFKIELKSLEDDLLNRLSTAQGNFLGDITLVEQLENTKSTATTIQSKVRLLHWVIHWEESQLIDMHEYHVEWM